MKSSLCSVGIILFIAFIAYYSHIDKISEISKNDYIYIIQKVPFSLVSPYLKNGIIINSDFEIIKQNYYSYLQKDKEKLQSLSLEELKDKIK